MLSEQVFEGFCQLVLASDDGTGSHCELVQDFLKERGASEKVEQMVCDRLQEIRDSERLKTAYKPLTIPDRSKAKTAESAMAIKELQSVVDDKNTRAADVGSRAKVALRQERSGAATAPAARRGEHDTAVMAAPTAIYKHTKALADVVGIPRLAIVENPEGSFERAEAENLDSVTIEEFTRACTESVQAKAEGMQAHRNAAEAAKGQQGASEKHSSEREVLSESVKITALAADDAVRLVRMAIVADPEGFLLPAVAGSKDETISRERFENLLAEACTCKLLELSAEQISESAKGLFDQLDADKDDKISISELTGFRVTCISELTLITDMIRHFWKESDCESVILFVLMGLVQDVQSKRESNRVTVSSDVDCVGEQTLEVLAGLQEDVLRNALSDEVAKAVAKHGAAVKKTFASLKRHGNQQEDQCASKFGLDTATYGSVTEYHRGLDVIGAPHPKILDHMEMEAKGGPDSSDKFEAWNSGKNITTAQKEWDFVYDPYKSESVSKNTRPIEWEERHDYGGNRSPIRLQVFMHAFSATPMSKKMGAGASFFEKDKPFFGDYKKATEFEDTDPRWLHPQEVSTVQVVLMRLVKSQLDGVSLNNALDMVKDLSGKYTAEQANIKAYDIVNALDKAFHEKTKTLHSKCTLSLAKALKKEITEKVARGMSDIDPVRARVLKHLHEVAQKQDSIDVPGHKEWLVIEDSKFDPDCTFDLLVDTFKDIATKEEIVKKLDKVLHDVDGPHSTCTFQFLVSKLAGIASEKELEAIMHHFHTKIAEAKMLEAEVIGLREYSGPLYTKMNGSLRVVGAHVMMVISLSCALKKFTQDVKQTLKEVVAEVANSNVEMVSIDSVSELATGTQIEIEFRVGVAPERKMADAVSKKLTESAINDGAKKMFKNISVVKVVKEASVVALPEHLQGNRYVNSIFACASGMRKMAQVSRIPRGRVVFRGMGGIKLPDKFLIEKEGGGRGGVDYGAYVLLYCFYVALLFDFFFFC
jgi:hypothetical protein